MTFEFEINLCKIFGLSCKANLGGSFIIDPSRSSTFDACDQQSDVLRIPLPCVNEGMTIVDLGERDEYRGWYLAPHNLPSHLGLDPHPDRFLVTRLVNDLVQIYAGTTCRAAVRAMTTAAGWGTVVREGTL